MIKGTRIKYEGELVTWFNETFRTHSKEEYFEFITRGMGEDGKKGVNAVYPWVYSRVLLFCFVVFSVLSFITEFTFSVMSGISHPVLVLTGAMLVTAPVTVLLYELYPKRDLCFLKLLLVFVTGGVVSDIIISLGYYFVSTPNEWLDILWTAFLEEAGKAIPAIIAILVLKRDNPLKCFIIAAAVGAGMSVAEDMGYIFFGSVEYGISVSSTVSMAFIRGLTSISGHVLWTGLIGWAFGKFRRPLIDIRFWGVCVGSMALHYLWDFPLPAVSTFTLIGAFVGGIVILALLLRKERSAIIYAARGAREDTEYISDGIKESEIQPLTPPARSFDFCNITAVICAVIISACGLIYCTSGTSGGYEELYFATAGEFAYFVQDGENYEVNVNRPIDSRAPNYSEYRVEGKIVEITQREVSDGTAYYYTYYFDDGIYLSQIEVEVDGALYPYETFVIDDEEYNFFYINPKVVDCYYDVLFDEFVAVVNEPVISNKFVIILLGSVSGLALIVGAGAYIYGLAAKKRKKAASDGTEEIQMQITVENDGEGTENE